MVKQKKIILEQEFNGHKNLENKRYITKSNPTFTCKNVHKACSMQDQVSHILHAHWFKYQTAKGITFQCLKSIGQF